MTIIERISKLKSGIAILIDPDKFKNENDLNLYLEKVGYAQPDILLIGGSTVSKTDFQNCVASAKSKISAPIVLFPGGSHQISGQAP